MFLTALLLVVARFVELLLWRRLRLCCEVWCVDLHVVVYQVALGFESRAAHKVDIVAVEMGCRCMWLKMVLGKWGVIIYGIEC